MVAREVHARAVAEHGLRVSGIRSEYVVRDNLRVVTTASEVERDVDYFILLVKSKDTSVALEEARVFAPRVRTALSLQNNVVKEDHLVGLFGPERVIGASTIEGGVITGPGEVRNTATAPVTAYFGEIAGGESARTVALAEAFSTAGLASKSVPNIMHVEWEKLLQIGTAAGWAVSALAGTPAGSMGDGLAIQQGAELHVMFARDMLAVYESFGYEPQDFYAPFSQFRRLRTASFEEMVEANLAQGRQMRANNHRGGPSMLQDVRNGRRTEVDYILGPFIKRADEANLSAPTLQVVYRICKVIDEFLN
jgi:2-dehydropantoate 2-reductase